MRWSIFSAGALAVGLAGTLPAPAASGLKEAKFTAVVNKVAVTDGGRFKEKAQKGETVRAPEGVQTGAGSRAELTAPDATITRLGAHTSFRFGQEPRTLILEEGSLLFYSPPGKGGGTVRTAAVTAAVTGSTFMASTNRKKEFKAWALQHTLRITFKGKTVKLEPGQMIFITPDMAAPPKPVEFRIQDQADARLMSGFARPLPSQGEIREMAARQAREIGAGRKLVRGAPFPPLVDSNTQQAFTAGTVAHQILNSSSSKGPRTNPVPETTPTMTPAPTIVTSPAPAPSAPPPSSSTPPPSTGPSLTIGPSAG